jgi:hypothetical protein
MGLLWENGTYMFKKRSCSQNCMCSLCMDPPGPGYFARHTEAVIVRIIDTPIAWAETATGSFLPRCWATARLLGYNVVSTASKPTSRSTVYQCRKGQLEPRHNCLQMGSWPRGVWCEYVVAYPCVYKVFDLHESTGVYIKCEEGLQTTFLQIRSWQYQFHKEESPSDTIHSPGSWVGMSQCCKCWAWETRAIQMIKAAVVWCVRGGCRRFPDYWPSCETPEEFAAL